MKLWAMKNSKIGDLWVEKKYLEDELRVIKHKVKSSNKEEKKALDSFKRRLKLRLSEYPK